MDWWPTSSCAKSNEYVEGQSFQLGLLCDWHERVLGSPAVLPLREHTLHTYVEYLKVKRAPAFRGQRFVEAPRFCEKELGLPMKSHAFSARISGAVERMLETKRIAVHVPPLPVLVVRAWEKHLMQEKDVDKRSVAGSLRFRGPGVLRPRDLRQNQRWLWQWMAQGSWRQWRHS